MEQLETARILEIHAQALLAHVLLQEIAALAIDENGVGAAGVAGFRALDLDDFGAQRRQTARQMGTGQKMAVVDDTDAGQGKRLMVCLIGHEIILVSAVREDMATRIRRCRDAAESSAGVRHDGRLRPS